MSNYLPADEKEAMEFLEKRRLQEEKERFNEDVKRLKVEPLKLLSLKGFEKSVAGVNFDKVVKAFGVMRDTPKKGIIISGAVGTGKTLALKALFPFTNICKLVNVCELQKIEPHKNDDGDKFWSVPIGDIILDDLGNEAIKSDYGIKVDVLCDFIMYWHTEKYENCKDNDRIFATTNLNAKQLQDRYGDRIVDRLLAMCVFVNFEGTSKREKPIII